MDHRAQVSSWASRFSWSTANPDFSHSATRLKNPQSHLAVFKKADRTARATFVREIVMRRVAADWTSSLSIPTNDQVPEEM